MSNESKVFLVILVLLGGGVYYGLQQFNASAPTGPELATEPVTLVIEEGSGARDVARALEDAGLIGSASTFLVSATADGAASQLKAGIYEDVPPGLTHEQLIELLVAGPPGADVFTVTIPEGLTVQQTLESIASAEGSPHTVESLRAALVQVALPAWVPPRDLPDGAEAFEGLLFPNTYEFVVDAPPEQLLTRLVQETDRVMTEVGFAARNGLDLYQTLVLGSLIEREARLADEQPVISSVIHNRLEDGMALQIDATVVYGIAVATGERPDRLVNEDYQFETPWSTYRNTGLPPTPISGAGRTAIEAAAAPADTGFYYYVVEDESTGAHRFTETLAQHEAAIAEIRGG